MKKLLAVCAVCAMLAAAPAGCSSDAAEAGGTAVPEETALLLETSETAASAGAEAIPDNGEYPAETFEEDIAEEDDVAVEEDIAEPAVVYDGSSVPENARVYKFNNSAPEELPEFSMSLDGYGEYSQMNIARVRLEIKAMLECSLTGEIPYIDQSDYSGYECRRLENVRIDSWSVKDEKYTEEPFTRYEVTLTLGVAESESEFVPVGTADYLLVYCPGEDRLFLPLRKAGELDESSLLPFYGDGVKEYVNFCTYYTAYFRNFFDGDVIDDFSAPETNLDYIGDTVFCAYVAAYRAGGFRDYDLGIIPYDEFNVTLKKTLGFSADAIDAKNCPYYNAANDTVEIPGRGTSWLCGWLAEDTDGDGEGVHIVTVDYYEDDFYLIKSRTVRYTVRENGDGTCSMLKIERLFTSDRGILGGSV
ncbi:MAG: hypothetical protein NC395_09135 [Prevotella sp.]|nr:hypothetical protein [Prevotella sp.]